VAKGRKSAIALCRKLTQNCVVIISTRKEEKMSDSVYKVIELVGSSETSWEEAAKNAVARAGQTLRDLRVAEVTKLDMKIENGKITAFRTRVNLSFKYGGGE
jgi:flavin-binding protein dodecin